MFDYFDNEIKDFITPMQAVLEAQKCYIRYDDKIAVPVRDVFSTPWIHAKIAKDRDCLRYQNLYHGIYGFIPRKCMQCWKVVQRPRNLKELFDIYNYQKELRLPSKCGIETRHFVHGNYGAYWYTNSTEEGLDLKDMILKDFPKIPTILKRGCTEFEMSHGPSDRWEPIKHFLDLEDKLDEMIVYVYFMEGSKDYIVDGKPSPWYVDNRAKRAWVEFAFDRGDPAYKLYTQGKPLLNPVVTYERPLENGCQVDKLIEIAKR